MEITIPAGFLGESLRDGSDDSLDFLIGQFVPTNELGRDALSRLVNNHEEVLDHHRKFLGSTSYDGEETNCFDLMLDEPTSFFAQGWTIGTGRANMLNKGVDLLLPACGRHGVAGIHGRFCYKKGVDGLFMHANNARGVRIIMNGKPLTKAQQRIPFENAIQIGECCFTFLYPQRPAETEQRFQEYLTIYKRLTLRDLEPLVLPTPRGTEAKIGDWLLQYALNKGSFGDVFFATHVARGEPGAVKRLVREQKTGQDYDNELRMTKVIMKLKHKHIASPVEILEQDKIPRIEIERLKSLLGPDWKPFNDSEAAFIVSPVGLVNLRWVYDNIERVSEANREIQFGQVLDGGKFLHENHILHGDLKPNNILVLDLDPPHIRITDFGCSVDATAANIVFRKTGTLWYLAPEQLPGEPYGLGVDVWAAGLIGTELVTKILQGRVQAGRPIRDVLNALQQSSSRIAPVCEAMLQLEPAGRPSMSEAYDLYRAQMKADVAVKRHRYLDDEPRIS